MVGLYRRLGAAAGVATFVLAIGAAFLISDAAALPACTDTYSPTATTFDWSTAANWSKGVVPGTNDVACWGSGQTLVVTSSAAAASMQGGGLSISGGSLQLYDSGNDSTLGGPLSLTGGNFGAPSSQTLTLSGDFDWAGTGSSSMNVTLVQTGSHAFAIDGTGQAYMTGGSITTSNPVTVSDLHFISTGSPKITTTSTLTLGPGTYDPNGGTSATIVASGVKTSGDTVVQNWTTEITGTDSALVGNLTLPGLKLDSGASLGVPAGKTLTMGVGSLDGTLNGPGGLAVSSSTAFLSSTGTLNVGSIAVPNGTLTLQAGGTISGDPQLSVSGGTLNVQDNYTVGSVSLTGGSLASSSGKTLSVAGDFDWANTGSSSMNAAINQVGGSSFAIDGSGQAYMTGGSVQTIDPVVISNLHFITAGSPTIATSSTAQFGPGTFDQNGGASALVKAAGIITTGDTTVQNWTTEVTGNASTLAGNLTLSGLTVDAGDSISVPAGKTLTAQSGAVSGAIDGPGGYAQGGGTLTVTPGGALSVSSVGVLNGTLTVQAGATVAGSPPVSVAGGTLNLQGDDTVGAMSVSGGNVYGINGHSVTVNGNFDWAPTPATTGAMDLNIIQPAGYSFRIDGTGQAYMTGGSVNTGSPITISDPHFITTGAPSIVTSSTAQIGPGTFDANGGADALLKAAGLITTGDTTVQNWSTEVTGTSSSLVGNLSLAGLKIDSGASLSVPSGKVLTQQSGQGILDGTLTGPGGLTLQNGSVVIDAGGSLGVPSLTMTGGSFIAQPGGPILGAPSVDLSGGSFNLNDNDTIGALTMSGGQLNTAGGKTLSVAGNFDWNGQSALNATLNQTGGTKFLIEGTGQNYLTGGSLTTGNPITISDPGFITAGNAQVTTTSTLDLANGLSIPINGGNNATFTAAGVGANTGPSYGVGADTLVLTGGTTQVPAGETLTAGAVTLQGATLQDDGTVSAPVSLPSGLLKGTGTVSNGVANTGGTVAPGDSPGTLSIGGDYTQGSGGTLAIAVNGATSGQYSALSVGGNVSLDGTLALQPSSAYANSATPGDTIPFLSYPAGTRTGSFATTTVTPPLANQEPFQADYSPAHAVDAVVGNPPAPANSGGANAPSISGTPQQGQTLTAAHGTWTNHPTSYDYQWQACDSSGNNCSNVGTDSNTYVLTSSDVSKYMQVLVTAHNAGGQGQATSPLTAQVIPLPPVNSGGANAPSITGTPQQGQALTANPGTWSNSPSSYVYQWQACDSSGNNCQNVGSNSNSYTPTASDVNTYIHVVVTAKNAGGPSNPATSALTGQVTPPAPTNTGGGNAPAIIGTAKQGNTLTANAGTWSNNPTSFAYQWQACDSAGKNCSNVGTNSANYTPGSGDVGKYINVVVTATNAGGSTQATSGLSSAVQPALPPAPTNSGGANAPSISGTAQDGKTLSASPGTWSNNPTGYDYQWQACDSAGKNCQNVGSNSNTYTPGSSDVGKYIQVLVTAKNAGGSSSPATSSLSSAVQPATPVTPKNITPPTIVGTPLPGNTLTCEPGTWTGSPTSYDYQWNQDTSNIPDATHQQYQVQISNEGHSLGCGVTAGNGGGSSAASASATVIVAVKGTLNCPKPSGQISGSSVGPLSLGMKQSRARGVLNRFAVTTNHFDDFCLYGGWGIRAGYPSGQLLRTLPANRRKTLAKQIVIALTANPFYSLNGVRPGMSLAAATASLHLGKAFHLGLNYWYVAKLAGPANGVLKIRGGIVQEIGLVSKQLTKSRKAQGRLLSSFK